MLAKLTLTDFGLELRLLGILLCSLLGVNLLERLMLFLMFFAPKVELE